MGIWNRAGVRKWTANAASGIGIAQHPRISIKGGRFALVDGAKVRYPWPNLTLPVVFVATNPHKSKLYYPQGYDDENPQPPLCFSDNGVAPSRDAQDPQSRTCAECRWNVFGTADAREGGTGRGKACADRKKMACFVVGDPAVNMLYEFSVSPMSLTNWKSYCDKLQSYTVPDGSRQAELDDVVTEITFDPNSTFKLQFEAGAWIDQVGYDPSGKFLRVFEGEEGAPDGGEAIAAFIDNIWSEEGRRRTDEIVGLNDVPFTQIAPAAPAPQIEAPRPAPAPAPDPKPAPAPAAARPYGGPPGAPVAQPVPAFGQDGKSSRGGARPGAGRPRKADAAPAPASAPEPEIIPPANPRTVVGRPAPFPHNGPMERHGIVAEAPAPNKEIEDALKQAMALSTE